MRIYHGSRLRRNRYSFVQQAYLITTVTKDRQARLAEFVAARVIIRNMQQLDRQALVDSMAFVVMPDHVHWLLGLRERPLADVMRLFKGRTARALNRLQRVSGSLWQAGYHEHAIREEEDLAATARYIVANPIRAGLVASVRDYPYWDAIWL